MLCTVAAIKTTHKGIDSSAYESQMHFKFVQRLEKCQNTLQKNEMGLQSQYMMMYLHMVIRIYNIYIYTIDLGETVIEIDVKLKRFRWNCRIWDEQDLSVQLARDGKSC